MICSFREYPTVDCFMRKWFVLFFFGVGISVASTLDGYGLESVPPAVSVLGGVKLSSPSDQPIYETGLPAGLPPLKLPEEVGYWMNPKDQFTMDHSSELEPHLVFVNGGRKGILEYRLRKSNMPNKQHVPK